MPAAARQTGPSPVREFCFQVHKWIGLGSLAFLIVGAGVLAGRSIAIWFVLPFFLIVQIFTVLAFRVPAGFLPRWILDEIEAGRVAVAEPDEADRAFYRRTLIIMALGEISIPLIVLTGSGYR